MIHCLSSVLHSWSRLAVVGVALLLLGGYSQSRAQTDDAFGDGGADPVKLFERGQNAHAHGDLIKALEFYEEAIKVRPEFAEAEFQKGNVLVALGRVAEAESDFRRAIELRKDWSLPYAALGVSLVRLNRDADAEPVLRQAIKLDAQNNLALRLLADVRLRAGDAREALDLLRRATADKDAPASAWLLRAMAERATGDNSATIISLDRVLAIEPENLAALMERADVRSAAGDKERALADLKAAEPLAIRSDASGALLVMGENANLARLASAYERAGRADDARRVAEAAGLKPAPGDAKSALKVVGTPEEIEAANSDDPAAARRALETLLEKNPGSALLLSRLGAAYRTGDSSRSLDYYKRAAAIDPANPDYATGYSAALVQARRFAEAAVVLRRVIADYPNNYVAHANLATALYELKHFVPAVDEFQWLLRAKPDLAVAYYFIATAHDNLGEYQEALSAYESFLSRASAQANQLEIDKVNLRLPALRRQIKLGQGVKRKAANATQP